MVRKTKEQAQETRNRLLDAAERLFHEKGVSRTSLADIAAAADLTRGAVYWHFKNKADLCHAMMERVSLPLEEMVDRTSDTLMTQPLEFMKRCSLNALIYTANDQRCAQVFDIVMHKCEFVDELLPFRERHLEARKDCLNHIRQALNQAIVLGQLPSTVKVEGVAIGLHALIDGLIANWVLDPSAFSLIECAEPVIDTFLNGLKVGQPVQ